MSKGLSQARMIVKALKEHKAHGGRLRGVYHWRLDPTRVNPDTFPKKEAFAATFTAVREYDLTKDGIVFDVGRSQESLLSLKDWRVEIVDSKVSIFNKESGKLIMSYAFTDADGKEGMLGAPADEGADDAA